MKLFFTLALLGLFIAFVSSNVIDDRASLNGVLMIDGEPISEEYIKVYGLDLKVVKRLAKKFRHLTEISWEKTWKFIKCMVIINVCQKLSVLIWSVFRVSVNWL